MLSSLETRLLAIQLKAQWLDKSMNIYFLTYRSVLDDKLHNNSLKPQDKHDIFSTLWEFSSALTYPHALCCVNNWKRMVTVSPKSQRSRKMNFLPKLVNCDSQKQAVWHGISPLKCKSCYLRKCLYFFIHLKRYTFECIYPRLIYCQPLNNISNLIHYRQFKQLNFLC